MHKYLKTSYMFRQQGAILRELVVKTSISSEDGNSVPKHVRGVEYLNISCIS